MSTVKEEGWRPTVRLDETLEKAVKEFCRKRRRDAAGVMREALVEFLEARGITVEVESDSGKEGM